MKPVEIAKDVYSLMVNHFNRQLFDALIPLPDGTSYNSYIIKGGKYTALLDTVDPEMRTEFFDYLSGQENIDFIVSHHCEQDHSGLIPSVLEKYPGARVVTNARCKELLISHLHIDEGHFHVVADGEKLDLGGRTLEFVFTPWVHWPETFCTYLVEEKILFSCDFFGSHLATSVLYSSPETVYEPMKRYYAEIMMPFRQNIRTNLEKLSRCDINMICPSHGPIHKDPEFAVNCYKDWALSDPGNKALVLYVSMHGSTKQLADKLASSLQDRGVGVEKLDLSDADIGRVAMAMVDAATIVIATPTVLGGPHPKAIYAAYLARLLRPKVMYTAIMCGYGWSGKTVDVLSDVFPSFKTNIVGHVAVKGMPTENDLNLVDRLADQIAAKHLAMAAK